MNKKSRRRLATLALLLAMLVIAIPVQAAPGANSLNARAVRWQESANAIHVVVFADEGREGQPPAVVGDGETVILLFEWSEATIADLYANFLDDPAHTITLSVDGGPAFSVKDWYQTPFVAATRSGPRWSWDHDGDGPGDGDGDGIGDWTGPVLFWRYPVTGLSVGTHTLTLDIVSSVTTMTDTLTVEVAP